MWKNAYVLATLLIVTAGCAADPPKCPAGEQALTGGVASASFTNWGSTPAIVLSSHEAMACYTRTADGHLGERFCKMRYWDNDWTSKFLSTSNLGVVLSDDHLALYRDRHVVRADFGTDVATETPLEFDVGTSDAHLVRLFEQPDGLYAIWTSMAADDTMTAGLAQIGDDDVVRAVGAPFFSGMAVGYIGGAFDPDNDRFLVDSPDGVTLLELDREGNLLAANPHGEASGTGARTHLDRWTHLATGAWVGINGGWMCHFDPHDRSTESCFLMLLGSDAIPSKSLLHDLTVDADANLWASHRVSTNYDGVSIGRYDGNDRFDGPFTPVSLDTCDFLAYPQ